MKIYSSSLQLNLHPQIWKHCLRGNPPTHHYHHPSTHWRALYLYTLYKRAAAYKRATLHELQKFLRTFFKPSAQQSFLLVLCKSAALVIQHTATVTSTVALSISSFAQIQSPWTPPPPQSCKLHLHLYFCRVQTHILTRTHAHINTHTHTRARAYTRMKGLGSSSDVGCRSNEVPQVQGKNHILHVQRPKRHAGYAEFGKTSQQ